jgi:hypothetical protein
MILMAVDVASPGTIILEDTYIIPNPPVIAIIRYNNPAILAFFFFESILYF